jgi:thiol:disulfide interchange protein DsbD
MRIAAYILVLCLGWLFPEAGAEPKDTSRPALDMLKNFGKDSGFFSNTEEFLPPDQAFILSVDLKDPTTLIARWEIAKGYYLYRDKFHFKVSEEGVKLAPIVMPKGREEAEDPNFGKVEIYTDQVEIEVPLERVDPKITAINLTAGYQGCAEDGICYPPMVKTVPIELAAFDPGGSKVSQPTQKATSAPLSEQDDLARRLAEDTVWWTLLSFLGFGLLLSFTPCIFPVVPILSGIIVGQGKELSTRRAFVLSLVFVLAMAVTYALVGVMAGLFGQNLQTIFQNRWVLIAFAAVFVILALSMFGLFKLHLPSGWQSRINETSNRQQGGTLRGVAVMGLLSALIVGPCVAPPLAGALLYIGRSGDALLGGLALFSLGLGMGLPLLVIGASAGKLLPKAGVWMETVQAVFGVILLGVAVWLLERVLPGPVTLLLWGLLAITTAIYMGAMDLLDAVASPGRKLSKGLGLALLIYGAALIIGAAGGASDVYRPLGMLVARGECALPMAELKFSPVKGVEGLKAALQNAQAENRHALLDLYADWCVECKLIEKNTFANGAVRQALTDTVLLRADLTANDPADRKLLGSLELYGPPAILFFSPDKLEKRQHRLVGYIGPEEFRSHLKTALAP